MSAELSDYSTVALLDLKQVHKSVYSLVDTTVGQQVYLTAVEMDKMQGNSMAGQMGAKIVAKLVVQKVGKKVGEMVVQQAVRLVFSRDVTMAVQTDIVLVDQKVEKLVGMKVVERVSQSADMQVLLMVVLKVSCLAAMMVATMVVTMVDMLADWLDNETVGWKVAMSESTPAGKQVVWTAKKQVVKTVVLLEKGQVTELVL